MNKKDAKRSIIVDQTLSLFSDKGFANVSTQDIKDATGLRGGFYGYFISKEELAIEVLKFSISQIFSLLKNIKTIDTLAQERLEQVIEILDTTTHGTTNLSSFVVRFGADNKLVHKEFYLLAQEALKGWVEAIASILEHGKEYGEIGGEVDSKEVALVLVTYIQGQHLLNDIYEKDFRAASTNDYFAFYLKNLFLKANS